jgi:hypothetical protein
MVMCVERHEGSTSMNQVQVAMKRTHNLLEALQMNMECWQPIPTGSKVFDCVDINLNPVRVTNILDDTKKQCGATGYYLGCVVEGFEMRIHDLVRLTPDVIQRAVREKNYSVVNWSPRLTQAT